MSRRLVTLLEQVRGEASGERALAAVRRIAGFHRIQSSPGYAAAAQWVAGELRALELVVEIDDVPADGRTRYAGALMPQAWSCARAIATLVGSAGREPLCDFDAEPLSLIQRSTSARGTFPIVALADPEEPAGWPDVAGAVVLTAGAVHRGYALAVLERGAAGLLSDGRRLLPPVRTDAHDRESLAYTSFWWDETLPRGWGFVVSPASGARLRERLRAGEALALDVDIETRFEDGTFPVVSARIASLDPAAREVLVISHLCHPQPGANDNASGAAASLEVARTLTALRARGAWRPVTRAVRFLWMPEWNGTLAWLARDPARARRIDAAINLDMVGEDQAQCGSTLLLEHPPHFLGSFAEPLLADIRYAAQERSPAGPGPAGAAPTRMAEVPFDGGSDHAILLHPAFGIPCPMLIQWPDRFYHSNFDTPERCDPASLALAVRCAATYAGYLASRTADDDADLVASSLRHARRRVLDTGASPTLHAVLRERIRGAVALKSLSRLGIADSRVRDAVDAFEADHDASRDAPGAAPDAAAARVPVPVLRAPLDLLRHLMPGFGGLPAPERDAWGALERDLPGGRRAIEIAWYACDGIRTLAAIRACVAIECGVEPAATGPSPSIEALFERAARLGLSTWSHT